MKKHIAILLVIVLVTALFPVSLAAETQLMVVTPGGWLNLRKAPQDQAEIKEFIPNGDPVTLLEHLEGGWSRVQWKNATGYVRTEYIGTKDDYLLNKNPGSYLAYSDSLFTYVRAEKDSLSRVVYTVEADTGFIVLADDGVWCHVKFYDQWGALHEGYILSSNISGKEAPAASREELTAEDMLVLEKAIAKNDQQMYLYPDASSAGTEMLPKGSRVTVEEVEYPWCRVSCGALGGWVLMEEITLIGETDTYWQDRTFYDYVASHYTATVPSGELAFYIYPRSELDKVQKTVEWDPEKPLIVLEKSNKQYGQYWARVWDGADLQGWVLASSLSVSADRQEYEYEHNVPVFTTAVAYAGPNGARMFRDGSSISPVKLTIPADTELHISLNANGYAHVLYEVSPGNEVSGYVPYEDLVLGFTDRMDEDYSNLKEEDLREQLAEEEVRTLADAYMTDRYEGFDGNALTVRMTYGQSPSGDQVFYDLAYFMGEEYRYAARVHAVTGNILYSSSYGSFYGDPEDGKITRLEALEKAEAMLQKKDRRFDPAAYTFKWALTQNNNAYEFKYFDAEGTLCYAASVEINGGCVEYANAVKRDNKVVEEAEEKKLTDAQLQSIANQALKDKYTAFDAGALRVVYDRALENGQVVTSFAYYDADGKYVYAAKVEVVEGKVLFTADYTDYDYGDPIATKNPSAEPTPKPEEQDIGKSAARSIADGALKSRYADFDPAGFDTIHETRKLVMPGVGGPLYQFDYYMEDDSRYACCMVDAATGEVLYTSNQYNSDLTEIDYDPTPEPTQKPEGERMGESAARQIADEALRGRYPEFEGTSISYVRCQLQEEDFSFDTPHYQFDYFTEDGDSPYCVIVHAITGKILYIFGSLPGEGNGEAEPPFRVENRG